MDHFVVVPSNSVSAGVQILMDDLAGPENIVIPELRPVENAAAVLEEPALQVEILAVALPPAAVENPPAQPVLMREQPPAANVGKQPVAELQPPAEEQGDMEAALLLLFAQNMAICHDMKPPAGTKQREEDDEENAEDTPR